MGTSGNIFTRGKTWAGIRSLALGEYSRVLRKRRKWPLPGRGRPVWVRAKRVAAPIRARLGTSDFLVIADLLTRGAADGRGEYDAAIEAAARHAGGADRVGLVLDLGANIGIASMILAQAFAKATIVAVEPDAANFELMRNNTSGLEARGGTSPVRCVRACVGATRRTVVLDRTAHGGEPWAIAMKDDACGAADVTDRVDVVTIEDLSPGDGPIDLLKCDIEGAERELFEHCGGWINRARVMVVELHAPYRREEFLEHVQRGTGPDVSGFAVTMLKENQAIQVLLLERRSEGKGQA